MKFMMIKSMKSIVKRIIIMHIMSVEERGADTVESEVDKDNAVIVGGGVKPMGSALVMLTGRSMLPAESGSIAAIGEIMSFMLDEEECSTTKRLLPKHILDRLGEDKV